MSADLLSPGLVAALAAASLGIWLGWARLRRVTRARGVAVLLLALALVSSSATAAGAANDWFGYAPTVADALGLAAGGGSWPRISQTDLAGGPAVAQRHPDGGVVRLRVPDAGSGIGNADALVWVPPQYLSEPHRRFPVVYLVHGSPGVPADWLRGGEAAATGLALARQGTPVVLVLPRLSRGWLDDPECVDGKRERVETHVVQTLVPLVDASLRTVPTRRARVIAGMSAGGYCALNLGLKHSDVFGTVVDLSGLPGPTHSGGLTALYGSGAALRARQDSPLDYLPGRRVHRPLDIWLEAGSSDPVLPGLRRVDAALRAADLHPVLRVRPGFHSFRVWRPALAESLDWAAPLLRAAAA